MRALIIIFSMLGSMHMNQPVTCEHGTFSGSIVVFGDSITEGFGTTDNSCSFALDLQDILHQHVTEVAHGGYRVDQMLPQLPDVVIAAPNTVVVELGTNDVRYQTPLPTFRQNYATIMAALPVVRNVICLSVWPSPGFDDPTLLAGYNAIIRQTCTGSYVDITVLAVPAYVNPDNWHPNDQGAYSIAAHLAPSFVPKRLWKSARSVRPGIE